MTPLSALLAAAGGALVVSARAITLGTTVVAAGALSFRLVVARSDEDRSAAAPLGLAAALMLVLIAVPRLWLQARGLVDAGDPVAPMMANVLQTTWGRGWSVQSAGALAAWAGWWLSRRPSVTGTRLATAGTLALCAAPALMGHAAAVPAMPQLAIAVDTLHTLAASSWIGALAVLSWQARGLLASAEGGERLARWIEAFHPMALWSAALVVASGTAGLWLRVQRLATLLHSDYGVILGAKLVLVILVVALGARNSRNASAAARRRDATLAQSLQLELFFALLTVVATALLVGSPPEPDA